MDKITADYRRSQFERLTTVYSEYPTKLKIIKPNGETNWLDITEEELGQISEILTRSCEFCGEKMYTTVRAHSHTEKNTDGVYVDVTGV